MNQIIICSSDIWFGEIEQEIKKNLRNDIIATYVLYTGIKTIQIVRYDHIHNSEFMKI